MGAKPRKKHVYWASRDEGTAEHIPSTVNYVEIHTAKPTWNRLYGEWRAVSSGNYERLCLEEATRLLGFTPEHGTCHPVTITVRRAGEVIRK